MFKYDPLHDLVGCYHRYQITNYIRPSLDDPDEMVRDQAAYAYKNLTGVPPPESTLAGANRSVPDRSGDELRKDEQSREWQSLAAIVDSPEYSGEGANAWKRRDSARKALRAAGRDAVPAIIRQLNRNGVGQAELAKLLIEIGDERAVQPILRCFERLRPYGYEQEAVEFFARIRAREAGHILVQYINDSDYFFCERIAFGLGLLGAQETSAALEAALENGKGGSKGFPTYDYGVPFYHDDPRRSVASNTAVFDGLSRANTEFSRSVIKRWYSRRPIFPARR